MRPSPPAAVASVVALAAGSWLVRHVTSPAVRGWSPPSGERGRAGGLAVRRLGAGEDRPVIVLLHGLTASGDWWGGGYDVLAEDAESSRYKHSLCKHSPTGVVLMVQSVAGTSSC